VSTDWTDDAACLSHPPDLWFADGYGKAVITDRAEAKRICGTCAVAAPCLQAALDREGKVSSHHRYGIWGELNEDERAERATGIPSARRRERPQPCGTKAAYDRHLKSGEKACEPCLEAKRGGPRVRVTKATADYWAERVA
jgi:hypothetical protein